MSKTLEDLEQRLGDGTVAKIAELLGLSPPKPLPITEGRRSRFYRPIPS